MSFFVYAYPVMKNLPSAIIVSLMPMLIWTGTLRAQSQAAAQENEAAYALLSSADSKGAAAAYQSIITGYPTDILVQSATIQLGICQFYLGEFDKALASLEKSKTGPALAPDQISLLDNLKAQILAAKAMSLPLADASRKGIFDQAIKSYTDFISKYPKSPDLEAVNYGRALCEYQISDFEKAAADLRENIQTFPTTPTIDGSKNLLAITLATQGGEKLSKEGADKDKGLDLLKQAEELLRGIITGKKDLALVNDANFQLGEILFMRAAFSPEADRKGLYEQAATAYMSVLPKEDIVAMQEEKVKSYGPQKIAALRAKNLPLKNKLDKENERELKKLSRRGQGGFNRRTGFSWGILGFIVLAALLWIAPLYLAFVNSVKSKADYTTSGPLSLPSSITFENITAFWIKANFTEKLWNSFQISFWVAIFGVLLSFLTAYAIGIGRIRGRFFILALFMIAFTIPAEALMYPLLKMSKKKSALHLQVMASQLISAVPFILGACCS